MNPFRCSPCNKTYSSKYQLTRHLESAVHSGKKLRCSHCSLLFNRPDALQAHIHTQHLKDSRFQCPHCNKQCASNYQLSQHLLMHSGARPIKCSQCPATFRYNQQLKDHENQHNGIKPYECPECSKSFTRLSELKTHEIYHSGERPYHCTKCSKTFPQHSHLQSHLRVHSGDRPFKCSKCPKKFKQSSHLRIHMSYHVGDKPFECSECGEKFRLPHTLKSHMRRHTGEKPYKCPHCPRAFTQSSPLKYHIEKMHGKKNKPSFQCKRCNKSFPTGIQLKAHQRTHLLAKSFSCIFCDYTCKTNNDLNRHLRRHNHEEVYVCKKCGIWHGGDHRVETCMGPPQPEPEPIPIPIPIMFDMEEDSPAPPVMEIQKQTNEDIILECKVCGVKMRNKQQLNGHMAIHSKKGKKRKAKLTLRKKIKVANSSSASGATPSAVDPLGRNDDEGIEIELITETDDPDEVAILETEKVRLGARDATELPTLEEENVEEVEEEDDFPDFDIKIESVRHVPQEELLKLQNLRPFQCEHCNKMFKTTEELGRHSEMHGGVIAVAMKMSQPKVQKQQQHQQWQPLIKKGETPGVLIKKKKKKKVMTEVIQIQRSLEAEILIKKKKKKPKKKKVAEVIQVSEETPKAREPINEGVARVNKKAKKILKEKEDEMPTLYKATKDSPVEKSRSGIQINNSPPVLQVEVTADENKCDDKKEDKIPKAAEQTKINSNMTPITSFLCKVCNRTFGNNGALGFHMKKKHPPKPKKVPVKKPDLLPTISSPPLPKQQPMKEMAPPPVPVPLALTASSDTPAKVYKCILCQYRTTERDNLTLHARQVHYVVNKHKCSSCWKAFPTQARLEEHVRNGHQVAAPPTPAVLEV